MIPSRQALDTLPDMTISHFPHCCTNTPDGAVTLADVTAKIRNPSPNVAALIPRIRGELSKAKRRKLKEELPAVSFGARFETVRQKEAPYTPSGLTVTAWAAYVTDSRADVNPPSRLSLPR